MVQGLPVDYRADIYELGIVLYQMLRGRVPFTGDTPLVTAIMQVHGTLPELHTFNPAIPPMVDRVLQKATAKRPEDRYISVGEFARDFRMSIGAPEFTATVNALNTPTARLAATQLVIPPYDTPPLVQHVVPIDRHMDSSPSYSPSYPVWTNISETYPKSPEQLGAQADGTRKKSEGRHRPQLAWIIGLLIPIVTAILVFTSLQIFSTSARGPVTPVVTPVATTITQLSPTVHPKPSPIPSPVPSTTPVPTPTPQGITIAQAKAVVQQYYSYVNNGEYANAYSVWGAWYQNKHTYTDFMNGYANTISDSIAIDSAEPQSNGTVKVTVTITATENSSSGPVMHTYMGYYLVGLTNNGLKFLDAKVVQLS
jgi:serine/threonine protein kinase